MLKAGTPAPVNPHSFTSLSVLSQVIIDKFVNHNRNSRTTGKYWLIKKFEVLIVIHDDVILDSTVYSDITYYTKEN